MILSCDKYIGRYDSFQTDLNEVKKSFPDSLLSHFPAQIKVPATFLNEPGEDNSTLSLFLEQEYGAEEIDSIQAKLDKNGTTRYNAIDSCLFVVNRFAHKSSAGVPYNQYSSAMDRPANCHNEYLPIPNFWNRSITTLNTPSKLPAGFTIYVIDAGKGIVSKDIQGQWKRFMPVDWKNGYTRGIAINKEVNTVIYWTAIW